LLVRAGGKKERGRMEGQRIIETLDGRKKERKIRKILRFASVSNCKKRKKKKSLR